MKINKIILGSIVALFAFIIFVYVFETDRSLLQFFIGFIIFIIPATFISSFQSTFLVFTLILFLLFYLYFGLYKYEYYDTVFGLFLAMLIGGSIAYFRINKYELFSPQEYKNKSEQLNQE